MCTFYMCLGEGKGISYSKEKSLNSSFTARPKRNVKFSEVTTKGKTQKTLGVGGVGEVHGEGDEQE